MKPIDNDLAGRDVPDGAYDMADDQALATAIRTKLNDLRQAIVAARVAGLTVQVPALVSNWLDTGRAPGEPGYWVIKRESL